VEGITARRLALPDGIALRVCEAGPVGGSPLLLLHGWGATSRLWRHNILPLAARGVRVIVPDLPGHGLSDAPDGAGEYTLGRFVARVVALLDLLGIARAPIAAQSMACKVAVRLALDHPTRVSSLTLFGAVGFGRVPPWRSLAPFTPLPPRWLAPHLVPRWAVAAVQRRVHGRIVRPSRADVDAVWAPSQFPDLVRAQLRMAVEFDWSEWRLDELARVRMPVHVVFGTRDRTVRARRLEERVAALGAGRLTRITDGGHVVMEEAPDAVNTILHDAVVAARLDSAR
jgi:pimeloyl-ACP methyl ester carboxylesterase